MYLLNIFEKEKITQTEISTPEGKPRGNIQSTKEMQQRRDCFKLCSHGKGNRLPPSAGVLWERGEVRANSPLLLCVTPGSNENGGGGLAATSGPYVRAAGPSGILCLVSKAPGV